MMKRFVTLLQREWMQHQRGWLILLALPWALVVGLGMFAGFQIEMEGGALGIEPGETFDHPVTARAREHHVRPLCGELGEQIGAHRV